MEKLSHYQQLIKQFMTEFANLVQQKNTFDLSIPLIFDDEHGQYLMLRVGWLKQEHIHRTLLHVSLHEDKFWIEEDWTEKGFANYLLEQNIPRDQIVLAFYPPQMRTLTDFAAA